MKLFLMRHGNASFNAPTDEVRPLSEAGVDEVARTASQLEGQHFDLVWVSPYLRAQQTWSIVKQSVTCASERLDAAITPGEDPSAVIDSLAKESFETVLLVCHQPLVGRLTSLLVEGQLIELGVGTATVICIECDVVASGCGSLQKTISP